MLLEARFRSPLSERRRVNRASHEPQPSPQRAAEPGEARVVFIAAGANLGERWQTLYDAFCGLCLLEQTWDWRASPLYETPPVDVVAAPGEEVPAFLNAVFAASTRLSAEELLSTLQRHERRAGRSDKGDHRSRALDLDLLALGNVVCHDDELTLPHPRLAQRWFVLKPLCDLEPEWRHPQRGITAEAMLATLEDETCEDAAIGRGWRYAESFA